MSRVAIIGSGNVGHHFAKKLSGSHQVSVFSRSEKEGVHAPTAFNPSAFDFALLAVPDDAIAEIAESLPKSNCVITHTSGSQPLSDLSKHDKRGVLYPLQTFTVGKEIDFNRFPIFIEGDKGTLKAIQTFAESFSSDVRHAISSDRAKIHLAAVFACNFANHMYAVSDSILASIGMSFKDLHHLAYETLEKATALSPKKAQTGPAIRNDFSTMSRHLDMIDSVELKKIYKLLSKDIRKDQP